MCDACGCGMPSAGRSRGRTLLLGLALAAVASFTGAFGFTSTALSWDGALASSVPVVSASFCPCDDGRPCCGFCTPAQRQR